MAVIRLREVVALAGRFPVLAGIDLDVGVGEVVTVQGANGAGKTSLLRLCAGLLRVESGTAEVLGRDLTVDRASVRRRVGVLGHDTALYSDLTVAENLTFWARASRVAESDIDDALGRLGVAPRLWSVPVGRISAGQRRRVALAAVLVRRPELWLLDEPHAGLDQPARAVVDELVAEAASAGATVVLASHELERAAPLATRTIVVGGGMIVTDAVVGAEGDPC